MYIQSSLNLHYTTNPHHIHTTIYLLPHLSNQQEQVTHNKPHHHTTHTHPHPPPLLPRLVSQEIHGQLERPRCIPLPTWETYSWYILVSTISAQDACCRYKKEILAGTMFRVGTYYQVKPGGVGCVEKNWLVRGVVVWPTT